MRSKGLASRLTCNFNLYTKRARTARLFCDMLYDVTFAQHAYATGSTATAIFGPHWTWHLLADTASLFLAVLPDKQYSSYYWHSDAFFAYATLTLHRRPPSLTTPLELTCVAMPLLPPHGDFLPRTYLTVGASPGPLAHTSHCAPRKGACGHWLSKWIPSLESSVSLPASSLCSI